MTKDASPQLGNVGFLENIRDAKIETNTKVERYGKLTVAGAKDFLALKNRKRLKALHRIGNHLQDKKIAAAPESISDETATKFLLLQKNLHAIGGSALVREFLSTSYCLQFVEQFSDIDPKKIALSFHSKSLVEKVGFARKSEDRELDPQFIPALNLGVFVALEHLQTEDIKNLSPKEATKLLELKKSKTTKWNEKILYGNLSRYLSKISDQKIKPAERDQKVAELIVSEVNSRLEHWTKLRKIMGQSQGTEAEIMRHVTEEKWKAWSDRYGLKDSLPRGVKPEMVKRTDWMLVGILGLNEDLGEKEYEIFELSTLPSESGTAQATMMQELMLGGFFDENILEGHSDGRERYSLHASTVFPSDIFIGNKTSTKQYVKFARAMGGAFSSLDRMKNGGFMTYENGWDYEIQWDQKKSEAKIMPVEGKRLSGNELLVEIRTLDVTSKDHLSALIHKEYFDYGFRTYWEQKLGKPPANSRDLQAASVWQNFDHELDLLNAEYEVPDHWSGTGRARERYPEYKVKLQKLIRNHSRQIRQIVEQPEDNVVKYELTRQAPIVTEKIGVKEDKLLDKASIALNNSLAKNLGVENGGLYTFKVGNSVRTVKVSVNDESSDITYSSDISAYIQIPKNSMPRIKFDHDRRELALGPVIGIAAKPSGSKENSPFGDILDWPLLNAQMEMARKTGAIVYAFDPTKYDSNKETLEGYQLVDDNQAYLLDDAPENQKHLTKLEMPVPDIIFDKTNSTVRDNPRYKELRKLAPISNEGVTSTLSADKLEFYNSMSQLKALKERMPEVRKFSVDSLEKMLDLHEFIVMKPRWGEEGVGIFYVKKGKDGSIEYSHPHWEAPDNGTEKDEVWITPPYQKVESIKEFMKITEKTRDDWEMILQQGIDILQLPERDYMGYQQMEIRTVFYRDQKGKISVLGEQEKLSLNSMRMASKFGLEKAVKITATAQKVAMLAALQHDKVLGAGTTNLLAVDCFIDPDGLVWLGESNSAPTLIWFNDPDHPYLLHELASEQIKTCVVQSGFAPAGKV